MWAGVWRQCWSRGQVAEHLQSSALQRLERGTNIGSTGAGNFDYKPSSSQNEPTIFSTSRYHTRRNLIMTGSMTPVCTMRQCLRPPSGLFLTSTSHVSSPGSPIQSYPRRLANPYRCIQDHKGCGRGPREGSICEGCSRRPYSGVADPRGTSARYFGAPPFLLLWEGCKEE